MNHCLLEVKVKKEPTLRYTQDNKIPIAEMEVLIEGLRADDPPGTLKVVGWGNLAQELQNRIQINQKLLIEGRLRMSTLPRQDGTKEKKAEFTLSRLHPLTEPNFQSNTSSNSFESHKDQKSTSENTNTSQGTDQLGTNQKQTSWDSSPLIPDTDEIPF